MSSVTPQGNGTSKGVGRLVVAVLVSIAVLAALVAEASLLGRGQERLDPAFGDRGIVVTAIVDTGYGAIADFGPVVVAPDGTIVAGGSFGSYRAIVRHRADGRRDASFGSGGMVRTGGSGYGRFFGIALQPDGMILAVATVTDLAPKVLGRLIVARFRSDGRPDSGFGTAGTVDIAGWSGRAAIAVDADGAIVVAGTGLARFTADGRLDAAFGTRGVVAVPGSGLTALAIGPDGTIVVAGSILARYTRDGRLDPTFGVDGMADVATVGTLNALALQPDGRIVVGGDVLARYSADGRLDPTFGDGGRAAEFGGIHAVAIGSDGGIIAGGTATTQGGRFLLVRCGPDGSPDPAFGTAGVVTTDVGGSVGGIRALALQPDRRIVVAGYRWSEACGIFGCGGVASDLLLARYDGR